MKLIKLIALAVIPMSKFFKISSVTLAVFPLFLIASCAGGGDDHFLSPAGYLGTQPDPTIRSARIANEPVGEFYYGRRYYINNTRFWGYLRKPGQPWQSSKLVLMNESSKRVPDRLPENEPSGAHYGYDQNYEYRISGNYTGRKAYDPNSNLLLPEFRPTSFTLLNKKPGWIFSQRDYYDPKKITLRAR
ncbi:MAG: hypothetical protein ACJAR1_000782 [Rubritalea sp.]|jgi:hypothetical protein|tara:strand:+ start:11981 stop:12547 length:567 start_codon:yes stop_codon:yes gene_type:complete